MLRAFGYDEWRKRQMAAAGSARPIGVGIACYAQGTGLGPFEGATVRVDPQGKVYVLIGVAAQGQGHSTTLAQIAASEIGANLDDVIVLGGQACAVEVDVETCHVRLLRHVVLHDPGRAINPAIVEGQLQGGAAQAIGAGLMEQVVYDAQGQLLSGSLMDYAIPKADDLPWLDVTLDEHPSSVNPLGVNGVGESGCNARASGIAHALEDALADRGVIVRELPVTPARLFALLHGRG